MTCVTCGQFKCYDPCNLCLLCVDCFERKLNVKLKYPGEFDLVTTDYRVYYHYHDMIRTGNPNPVYHIKYKGFIDIKVDLRKILLFHPRPVTVWYQVKGGSFGIVQMPKE